MNKNVEISFFIHLVIFAIMFYISINVYNINIFEILEKEVSEYTTLVKEEVIYATDAMYLNEPVELNKDGINLKIEEYKAESLNMIDNAEYTTIYYMPAFVVIFIVVLVNLEFALFNNISYAYNNATYDGKKDKNKIKLKRIIKQKLNFKYRRITLSKKIPIMYIACMLMKLVCNFENDIIYRTLENFMLIGAIIITFYGLRIVINLFRTNNSIVRTAIIILNICMGILYPQVYFLIGLFESIFSIRIIVRKKME